MGTFHIDSNCYTVQTVYYIP